MNRNFRTVVFARPEISKADRKAVDRVLKSGWITTGSAAARFEEEFRQRLNVPFAFAVNSATAGLHLALESLGIGNQDAVVIPSLTFAATAEAVLYCGARPVLADVDPETLTLSAFSLKQTLKRYGNRVKAVIPVHYGGRPCEMEAIAGVCAPLGIKIIEDAAHSFPGTYNDCFQGAIGDAGVYSFYATKTLTTGEGGMVVTRNPQAAAFIEKARLHGIDRPVWNRYTSPNAPPTYDVVCRGYKYNLTDMAAALGLSQLKRADAMRNRRKQIAEIYQNEFSALPGVELLPFDDRSSFHLYVVRIKDGKRNIVYKKMKENGVCCSIHYRPLHLMTFYQTAADGNSADLPETTAAYNEILSLPLFSSMSRKDLKYVVAVFKKTLYNEYK